MGKFFTKPWLRSFSGLFINFSAAYFGLAFIVPNFLQLETGNALVLLTWDMASGILFLLASVKIEELLEEL